MPRWTPSSAAFYLAITATPVKVTTVIRNDKVGFVFDDRYLQHNPGIEVFWTPSGPVPSPFVEPSLHPSSYRLAMRIKQLLDLGGLTSRMERIAPQPATIDQIATFHTTDYIERVRRLSSNGGGYAGDCAPVGPGSFEIARLSVGGAVSAVDAVMQGTVRAAFANCRPPGHHALADQGMGYCIFNNAVVAARHAQNTHGVERVLIIDWDVHHGNGTQEAFYSDPSVLFVSLHQDGLYPCGMGHLHESGIGPGAGTTVNLPLPAGSGDVVYQAAFERIVVPIVLAYRPDLILVSAGQDASIMDPEGRMSLTTEAYRWMTSALMEVASAVCDGRIVVLLEGGYSELYAPYCTLAIVESLTGIRTHLPEPEPVEHLRKRPDVATIGANAEQALGEIVSFHAQFWPQLRHE
jgi:acetoin utilization deacetylase AcuC-like enzyme